MSETKTAPCIITPKDGAEHNRQILVDADLLDATLRIKRDDAYVYLPVSRALEDVELELLSGDVQLGEDAFEVNPWIRTVDDVFGGHLSYEILGDIAILNTEDVPEEKEAEAAEAILQVHRNIVTVVKPLTPVHGEFRVKNYQVIAGEDKTETTHKEYGSTYKLNLQEVYFTPRLGTERIRVTSQVQPNETVVDMFAGVGPFTIPVAKKAQRVAAVDINPTAIRYLKENLETNKISNVDVIEGDIKDIAPQLENTADRIIMNLPHSAQEYLKEALIIIKNNGIIHYYDIRHEDDLFEGAEETIKNIAGEHDMRVEIVDLRKIRSYAPHQYNVVFDVRIEKDPAR